jgi:hypothetical protein
MVLPFTNTAAFERRCWGPALRPSIVMLLAPYCYEYASVARRSTARRIDALGATPYL